MQIPNYWAEARVEGEVDGKLRVVRRFGWSDEDVATAERHAEQRARQALLALQAGQRVEQRERKLAYGGEGLPIREQVIARNGDDVVTRNSYGARCLNEPDVLFADIDLESRLSPPAARLLGLIGCLLPIGGVVTATALFWQQQTSYGLLCLLLAVVLPLLLLIVVAWFRQRPAAIANKRQRMQERVREVVDRHPGSRFAVYETPAGMRLLALHATFDPTSEAVQQFFTELGADPAYAQMCALQACFRARVSPKPWRINVPATPTRAVWPVEAARVNARNAWIEAYEAKASGYAACRFVAELGTGQVHPRCRAVQQMHDEMCRARSELPIA